ncbi:hypothetical protein [Rufibacter latericius]|uniref:Uncharacterized protein n=1 Tax=Rufibacter latericius TaxID=2487040 RepID=A0A3M9MU43_9BACT|nr:hypothetical protein [Rufibacter latericius]RNI29041.1 hypothetical protein EFB08_06305 [Rufibacter latericius]
MKTQFSFTRFWWLFKKHTAEHFRYYLMSAAVLMGIMTLFLGFLIISESEPMNAQKQTFVFVILLLLTGPIFTSTIFSHLGDKKKAIATLTLPASHFEKYLVAWLYSYLLFQVVYIGSFYLVASILLPLDNWKGQELEMMRLFSKEDGQLFALNGYFLLHAMTFLGSIFFEKWHFIKTAFIFFTLGLALVILNKPILQAITGRELEDAFPFSTITFQEAGEYFFVQFPHGNDFLMTMALVGTTLFLWAGAYFKLKEKEV